MGAPFRAFATEWFESIRPCVAGPRVPGTSTDIRDYLELPRLLRGYPDGWDRQDPVNLLRGGHPRWRFRVEYLFQSHFTHDLGCTRRSSSPVDGGCTENI